MQKSKGVTLIMDLDCKKFQRLLTENIKNKEQQEDKEYIKELGYQCMFVKEVKRG